MFVLNCFTKTTYKSISTLKILQRIRYVTKYKSYQFGPIFSTLVRLVFDKNIIKVTLDNNRTEEKRLVCKAFWLLFMILGPGPGLNLENENWLLLQSLKMISLKKSLHIILAILEIIQAKKIKVYESQVPLKSGRTLAGLQLESDKTNVKITDFQGLTICARFNYRR